MWRKLRSRQHYFVLFAGAILLLQLFQIFYFQREMFLKPYDISYWKDRVEHSRYYLPLSNRGIGDDAFYAYAGYKVLQGEDPTKLVYDKPALGIVLIGLLGLLYNPSVSGFFFGIASLLLTYTIVYKLTKSLIISLLTVTFLAADPLFFQSMSISLLDLPQLFFLLLNIFCLQFVAKKKTVRLLTIFLSGLALGVFAQIKIPVIYPFVFLMEFIWLFKRYGKIIATFFLLGNALSVIPGYLPYAIHGYSFIDFVKIQKFILAFYRDSQLQAHFGAIWQYLLFGNFPGIADGVISRVAEWTIINPFATAIGLITAIVLLRNKKEYFIIKVFAVIVIVSLAIFTVIPAFPRYTILILPFLYFFMVRGILGISKIWSFVIIAILLIASLFNTYIYFHQSPSSFISYFYSNLSHRYFQDIYHDELDAQTKKQFTRDEFKKLGQKTFFDAKIGNITIKERSYPDVSFRNHALIPVTVTYKTEYLGNFTEEKNIELVRENDQWKVKWHWDYLFDGFNPNEHVRSTRIVGKRGSVIDGQGNVMIQDTTGYLVSFNPSKMDGRQENDMLTLLNKLSYTDKPKLQNTYLENPLKNTYIPLFTIQVPLTQQQKEKLLSYKGLKLQSYPTRIFYKDNPVTISNTNYYECCTRIYSSYNYHGNEKNKDIESMYDKQLSGHDGGSLKIINENGTVSRVIIKKEKQDGQTLSH